MTRDPGLDPRRRCAGANPETFFDATAEDAKFLTRRLCGPCPVRDACLEWAMEFEGRLGTKGRFGIYGGLTPAGRARLATKRRKEAAA